MREKAIRRAATAMRAHVERGVKFHTQPPVMAVVKQVTPLLVEVVGRMGEGSAGMTLDDSDLTFSQSARRYERDFGLKVNDGMTLIPVATGDWIVAAIVAPKATFEGYTTVLYPGDHGDVDTNTTSHEGVEVITPDSIWGYMAWKNAQGVTVGYVPIFASTAKNPATPPTPDDG